MAERIKNEKVLDGIKGFREIEKQMLKYKKLQSKTKKRLCLMCFKPMKMQIDGTTGKKSKYLWRCE